MWVKRGLGLVLLLGVAFGAGRRAEASRGNVADAIWAVNVSADVGGALVSLSPMLKNVCVYPESQILWSPTAYAGASDSGTFFQLLLRQAST